MNIGEAAKVSGINAKLIRHYESIGIIPKASRSESGYRKYSENDVHILIFVRRSRSLGFSMKEIKKLVSLWRNRSRASADVKSMTLAHIKGLEEKIQDLQAIRVTLMNLLITAMAMNAQAVQFLKIFQKTITLRSSTYESQKIK